MASKINKILTNRSQEFSNDELANVSASLSAILGQGGGGEPCASAWLPYVNSDGDLSWYLAMTTVAPPTTNIMGPEGPQGPSGTNGKDGTDGDNGADGISPTFTVTQITSGHSVTISGAQGSTAFNVLDGANGKDGKDGKDGVDGKDGKDGAAGDDGFSPTMSFTEAATSVDHENGGTIVTFTYGASGSQSTAYTAWNGNDGSGGGLSEVSAVAPLSGDGSSEHPLGIDMSSAYSIDGTHGITAIPNTADNKVIVQMTDDVWAYYQHLAASANIWDSASAIGNKSKTVINNSVNTITTENGGTSATLSAVEYKVNTSFQNAAPKQLFVVQDDNDIYAKLSEVNGKGSLFFVCSAI